MKTLKCKRILVCGKGGSGKSTIVSLLGRSLLKNRYSVILLDADASNPGGLLRMFPDENNTPEPLIEFFGGREKVTCPSDDPSPLTRINNNVALKDIAIELTEIPEKYSYKEKNLNLFQIGKIKEACEGCDGPMSKIARDFIVNGDFVTLIDIEAGIEHFGRGVEQNVDIILVIVDPTFESFVIAEIITKMSLYLGKKNVFAILNKIDTKETDMIIRSSLKKRGVEYLGSISLDKEIQNAELMGKSIPQCKAENQISEIVKKLEKSIKAENGIQYQI